jgi:starch-binding outer membrane protein, SusD/RagB family
MKKLPYILMFFALYSCESMDIDNSNEADRSQVYANPKDVKNLAESAFLKYWVATRDVNLFATSLVAADQFTASWYNFAWGYVSNEPRIPWDNSVNSDNASMTEDFYYEMYSDLSNSINPVIDLILNKNYKIGANGKDNVGILAWCYLLQGVILGQLSLSFDKAMIVKENTDLATVQFSDYNEVMNAALESLQKADSISARNSFQLNSSVVNDVLVDNALVNKLANSYMARFMVLVSRNVVANSRVDWNKVLEHANKGIDHDFCPLGDATKIRGGRWYDDNFYYLTNPLNGTYAYAFVDCRLIHIMDPDYPARYPSDGVAPQVHPELRAGEAKSDDYRLTTDFKYFPTCGFYAARGYYHFSHYQYVRYSGIRTSGLSLLYDYRKYENDLYKAEAYAMLNRMSDAREILNDALNPRVARGYLDIIPSSVSDPKTILDYIFYEREIELLAQGFMVGFCDMRRRDLLQKGTFLHYPVPGKELETLQLQNYTFGGTLTGQADGFNASNGGWFSSK